MHLAMHSPRLLLLCQANLDVLSWSLPAADMAALAVLADVAPQRMVDGSFWLNDKVGRGAVGNSLLCHNKRSSTALAAFELLSRAWHVAARSITQVNSGWLCWRQCLGVYAPVVAAGLTTVMC